MDSIWIDPFYEAVEDFGVFVVMGAPTDTTFRLPENARLRLEVTTSGGDSEDFAFQRYICPGDRDCTGLAVVMKEGRHASELTSALDGNTARLYSVSVSGRFAGIRVFDIRAVPHTLDLLSKNQSVSSASHDGLGVIIGGPSLPYSHVLGSLPSDFKPIREKDGVIQSGPGQTITVRYVQPDRTTLLLSHGLP